jgi:superfamily II DNA/RNA helicase
MPAASVEQIFYPIGGDLKLPLLNHLLQLKEVSSALVFVRTKRRAEELSEKLSDLGYKTGSLHGDLTQKKRDITLKQFRAGALNILVATDVASRGIDVPHVSHVINFDMPNNKEDYTHRIGRTGRAGKTGVALTLVEDRLHGERQTVKAIGRCLNIQIQPVMLEDFDYRMAPSTNDVIHAYTPFSDRVRRRERSDYPRSESRFSDRSAPRFPGRSESKFGGRSERFSDRPESRFSDRSTPRFGRSESKFGGRFESKSPRPPRPYSDKRYDSNDSTGR